MRLWKEAGHLIRLALLLAALVVLFFAVRGVVIPDGFGRYGHYRPGALEDVRAHPIEYAGRSACGACHAEATEVKQAGKHTGVSCEACHGPLSTHAEDPGIKPVLPQVAPLCGRCHEANSAKPKSFPQVNTKEHSGGESCVSCHKPHQPKFGE